MPIFIILVYCLIPWATPTDGFNICPPVNNLHLSSKTPTSSSSSIITSPSPPSVSLSSSSVFYLPSSTPLPTINNNFKSSTSSSPIPSSSSSPKIVCDCTTEARESAFSWEILCYQEYNLNEPNDRSETTVDPETVQYSSLPIAFIIKYVISRYVEINCYDSSPEFQPAMFQGFGVNEIDSFRVINCSLPTVPFNLIFHRTSIGSSKDSSSPIIKPQQPNNRATVNPDSQGGVNSGIGLGGGGGGSENDGTGGTTANPSNNNINSNKVKGIRSLELRRVKPLKVDIKQLKHLFHGLDRLEQLNLENYIISIPNANEKLSTFPSRMEDPFARSLARSGRLNGQRFKRSFGTRLNTNESYTFSSSRYSTPERRVTTNPAFGSLSPTNSMTFNNNNSPSTGLTVLPIIGTTVSPLTALPTTATSSSSPPLPSSTKMSPTKAPTIITESTSTPTTATSPGASSATMTTKKPTTTTTTTTTSIHSAQLLPNENTNRNNYNNNDNNNKYHSSKEFNEMKLNNHGSPDKGEDGSIREDMIPKSSSLPSSTSSFSSTSSPIVNDKPSSPSSASSLFPVSTGSFSTPSIGLETLPEDDLTKSSVSPSFPDVPSVDVGRSESQSFPFRFSSPIDFSFGSYFPSLKSLVLIHFLVTKSTDSSLILKSLLTHLNNLEQLDLRSNILTHIPENLFSGSGRKLKRLHLMRNSIESLHPYAFINLKELEVLDLFSNKIQLLPDSLLKDTTKLKQLRLKGNNFITLPLNLFSFTPELTVLDLSSNRELSLLPVDLLKGLNSLRDITINDCNLNRFTVNPAKFFSYAPNLEKIELKGNLLTNLTQTHLFWGNPRLTTLDVSNNRIKELHSEIFNENSSNLVNLNLYNNDLSFIPEELLYHLKNLKILNIGNNNLQTINNNIFYSLSNLEVLDLSRNQLITVNPGESKIPFGLGTYLKKINLSHNNLTNFNREFNSIQWNLHLEIEEINLSANKLSDQVTIPIFYSSKAKIVLDLRDNQIETIDMDAVLINEKLYIEILDTNKALGDENDSVEVKVFISGNPFNCDCNLYPLLKYTRSNTQAKYDSLLERVSFDISSDNLKCFSPPHLSGKSFYELNTIDLTCPLMRSKICPLPCTCWFRAHDERILIDCQSKNLTVIPQEAVNIANFQNLTLPGIRTGTLIKAVTLKLQNNRIKDLSPLERLISPPSPSSSPSITTTSSLTTSPATLIPMARKRFPIHTISFELYFDNNSIDHIPHSLVKLLKAATLPINEMHSQSSESIRISDSSPSSPSSSSSSPFKAAIVNLVSLRNNRINFIPNEFIDELRELSSLVANNSSLGSSGPSTISGTSVDITGLNVNTNSNVNNNGLASSPTLLSSSSAPPPAPKYLKLYLGNNPYNCTPEGVTLPGEKLFCQMRDFKSWLTGNYRFVGDIADINCQEVNYNSNSALINIPDVILCPQLATLDQTFLLALSVICISLALCLLLLSILYYRNRQTVLAFFYIHLNPIFVCLHFHEDDIDEDKIYDAFVSYSSADRDIVMQLIEKLEEPSPISNTSICYLQSQSGLPSIHEGCYDQIVPEVGPDIKSVDKSYVSSYANEPDRSSTLRSTLERGTTGLSHHTYSNDDSASEADQTQYFKLCIHERDWLPGNLISWNIVNSVQNSRRTIIILSKDFIQSIWFPVEFHTAYYQMLEDKIDRLIVIVRGELPPKDQMDKDMVFLLTTKTYLVWGEKWFWEKLRYALPHKSNRRRPLVPSLSSPHPGGGLGATGIGPNGNNKSSRCLKSHFSTNSINYLKSGKDGTSKSKSPSKSAMMKEYVDQAIADHFQLNSTSINGSPLKTNLMSNSKSPSMTTSMTTSSPTTTTTTTPTSPSLHPFEQSRPNYGSTSDPMDVNFSTYQSDLKRKPTGDYLTSKPSTKSTHGHVNESFIIETET